MKLLNLNIDIFEANNSRISSFLNDHSDVDIVCFQETIRKIDDSAFPQYISTPVIDESLPEHTPAFFAPVWAMDHFNQSNFHGKEEFCHDFGGQVEMGLYIKSKYPLAFGKNIFVQNQFSLIKDFSKWPEEDYRSVQVTDVKTPQGMLRVLNYHGVWSKYKTDSDLTISISKTIQKLATEIDYPSIICGDFNLFPDTESIKMFDSTHINLCNLYGISSTRPQTNELSGQTKRNVVDYIFLSKSLKAVDFQVVNSDVSDHLPLLTTFEVI